MGTPSPAPKSWPPEARGERPSAAPRSDKSVKDNDPLLAFRSESKIDPKTDGKTPGSRSRWITILAFLVVVLAAIGAAVMIVKRTSREPVPPPAATSVAPLAVPAEGTLTIDTRPPGAQVKIDGVVRGVTPLKLSLPVGDHTLDLQNGAATRSLPVSIQSNTVVSQYVDLPATPAASSTAGRLDVSSEPAGARVLLDGAPRGVTPVSLANVSPGSHTVTVAGEGTTVTRTVTVSAGSAAAVVVSLAPAGATAGWVSFKVPFDMQVLEDGRLVGTTGTDKLMLPAGHHTLELTNVTYEVDEPIVVDIAAGKIVAPTVAIPNGKLSINVTPWADVLLDGQAIGTTPLANLNVPVGTHEIICRHPQLGERRQTVIVKAHTPVRVGLSFSQ